MYYARNPVRLTFEDADWGTLTEDEESESEQVLSSHAFVPPKPFRRPTPAEVSTRDLQVLGKPLASALGASGAAADDKPCEEELNTNQRGRPTPGTLIWTGSGRVNQADQVLSLAPAALPVVTHKDVPHPVRMLDTTCVPSRSKVKPPYFIGKNELRQSVHLAALVIPKDATRSLPPAFSDSDDECDDPLATRLTTIGQLPKQGGDLEPVSTVEVGRCTRSYSDSPPGDIWAILIAEETKATGAYRASNCA